MESRDHRLTNQKHIHDTLIMAEIKLYDQSYRFLLSLFSNPDLHDFRITLP